MTAGPGSGAPVDDRTARAQPVRGGAGTGDSPVLRRRQRYRTLLPVAVITVAAIILLLGVPRLSVFIRVAPWEFWTLAALALIGDARPFALSGDRRFPTTIYPSVCFSFAVLLVWGPVPAVAVQAVAAVAGTIRLRMSVGTALFTVGRLVCAMTAAAAVLWLLGPAPFRLGMHVDRTGLVAIVAAALAWFAVNYLLITADIVLTGAGRWRHVFVATFGAELIANSGLLLLAPVLLSAPTGWIVLLLLVPLLAMGRMARLFTAQERALRVDPVTGLLSRRGLMARSAHLLAEAAAPLTVRDAEARNVALWLVTLDRFDYVSEVLGRTVADRLLVEVGARLHAVVGHRGVVGRIGSDEFAVLGGDVPGPAAAVDLATELAGALSEPAQVGGLPFDVTGVVGVALGPEPAGDFAALLRQAEVAAHRARREGLTFALYAAEVPDESAERLALLADLRRALEDPDHRDEISVLYQPQVVLATGELAGVEALLRWRHPRRGMVDPESLLAAAEPSGVMAVLTRRIIGDVVAQLAAWERDGFTIRAAVNVSMRDLHADRIVSHLRTSLCDAGIRPDRIQLEITERELMIDSSQVVQTVRRLAALGVEVSLDDFGTGFTSLQYLRRLPVAEVKIDRSFVAGLTRDPDEAAIVRAIIDLSDVLGLRVVAEGVEDAATAARLAAMGCEVGQGWFFGRPMPAGEVTTWLSDQAARAARDASWRDTALRS